jgi:hypothetical protein
MGIKSSGPATRALPLARGAPDYPRLTALPMPRFAINLRLTMSTLRKQTDGGSLRFIWPKIFKFRSLDLDVQGARADLCCAELRMRF